jgi:hypothetical protein
MVNRNQKLWHVLSSPVTVFIFIFNSLVFDSAGGPVALPSLYRRTAGPEIDRSMQEIFFFHGL